MLVNVIIIALAVFLAIKERETFKLALSYEEDEEVREEIKENKNLKKELEELFNFFEGGRNE